MIVDLTRTVTPEIPVYPGDPCPVFKKLNDVENDGFEMYEVASGMHVGTHMDAPLHFVKDGVRVDEIDVQRLCGKGVVIEELRMKNEKWNIPVDSIVIVKTGHETLWGTEEYFTTYPALTMEFAQACVEKRIRMVCVDMPSVDYAPHEVHKLLLSNGILIVENVCSLEALDGIDDFEVVALPVKYATEAAPCRVVAKTT